MAWDKLMRGLIHWNRLNPRPPLPDIFATPVVVTQDVNRAMEAEIQRLRQKLGARKEELLAMRQSTSWRFTAPL
ncbi:hypothetical protein, partial [Escherichia coli]|uniref:hypothetical protein n=1 Tax=Escherichia coli TaxID=562 RepID=UPI00321AF2CB